MTEIEAIETRVRNLPPQEFASFRDWFHQFDGGFLSSYAMPDEEKTIVADFLAHHPESKSLLTRLPGIVEQVYGNPIEKHLDLFADPDTQETMIEIEIFTHLTMGQEFDEKEEQLFKIIEERGLSAGLRHVIISQR